jgi:hypothetical protein
MSVDSKGSNGAPAETVNDVSMDGQNQTPEVPARESKGDTVAYETYKKTLALAKKRESELETERAEKQKLVEEKLASEGKKDELIESYKKKYSDLESKFKKSVGSFAYNTLSNAISLEATKEGCIDAGALLKLSELDQDMVDEDFNVNADRVKELVEKAKKDFSYLFRSNASAAKTGTPKAGEVAKADDWKKLPLKEQAMLAFKGFKN